MRRKKNLRKNKRRMLYLVKYVLLGIGQLTKRGNLGGGRAARHGLCFSSCKKLSFLDLHFQISWNRFTLGTTFLSNFFWTKLNLLVSLQFDLLFVALSLFLFFSPKVLISFHLMQIYGRFRPCYNLHYDNDESISLPWSEILFFRPLFPLSRRKKQCKMIKMAEKDCFGKTL